MSSVIQLLFSCVPFRDYVIQNCESFGQKLLYSLGVSFKEMQECSGKSMYLTRFREQFVKSYPFFDGYDQQDAFEFLVFLLNGLHDESKMTTPSRSTSKSNLPPVDYRFLSTRQWRILSEKIWLDSLCVDGRSFISDLFQGQQRTITTCSHCGSCSAAFETFLSLSLPVSRGTLEINSLSEAFSVFQSEQVLDGKNKYFCDKCKEFRIAKIKTDITRLPRFFLIIHLQRFKVENGKSQKLGNFLKYESSSSWKENGLDDEHQEKSSSLQGIVQHSGQISYGHYNAIVQIGDESKDDAKWFRCNDALIREVSVTDALMSSDTYLLIYAINQPQHD